MTKGVADIFEIAASTAAREADWRFTRPGALVSPRKVGGTEGDSRHACAEASISTFDESQLFNRDRPAVAADQARRGEGGGDHAAFTDSAKSSNETGTPWLSAISLIGTQYLDGILRGPSAHALTDTGLIMMPRATSAEWTAWGPPNFLEAVYDP